MKLLKYLGVWIMFLYSLLRVERSFEISVVYCSNWDLKQMHWKTFSEYCNNFKWPILSDVLTDQFYRIIVHISNVYRIFGCYV